MAILKTSTRNFNLNRSRKHSIMTEWIGKDNLYDFPYNLASKYIPALLIGMIVVTTVNMLCSPFRIDCKYLSPDEPETTAHQFELNNYCWSSGSTFIVEKALHPKMCQNVTYPGVSDYEKGKDKIIYQQYYHNLDNFVYFLFFLAYIPHLLFELRGRIDTFCLGDRLQTVVALRTNGRRATVTEKFLSAFARTYSSKVLAILTASYQIGFTILFFGEMFFYYGFYFLMYALGIGADWPNPMDAMFPKVAKCDVREFIDNTDMVETRAGICRLPLNMLTQYIFVMYWWAIVASLILNVLNVIILLFKMSYIVYTMTNIKPITAIPPTNQKVRAEINSITKFMKNGKDNRTVSVEFPESEPPNKSNGEEEECNIVTLDGEHTIVRNPYSPLLDDPVWFT